MILINKHKGATLFEILLVLVISSIFTVFSVQTYHQMLAEQQLNQIKGQVNTLFIAARAYYLANCLGNRSYSTGNVYAGGALDPSVTTTLPTGSSSNPGISSISPATLVTNGYLSSSWLKYAPSFTTGSYIVQYNIYNSQYQTNFCYAGSCTTQATVNTNNNYLITIQVAVQLSSTAAAKASYYQQRLNADCVSQVSSSNVTPCSASPTAKDYLVFERTPSMALSSSDATAVSSGYWPSMPGLAMFKRQYTNDDDYAVTTNDSSYNSSTGYENYLCGG